MSKTVLTPREACSITEAADLEGRSPDTIRRAIRATEGACLRSTKVGKTNRISASALEDWWKRLES
jgi:excisionase family DNA binding protein